LTRVASKADNTSAIVDVNAIAAIAFVTDGTNTTAVAKRRRTIVKASDTREASVVEAAVEVVLAVSTSPARLAAASIAVGTGDQAGTAVDTRI